MKPLPLAVAGLVVLILGGAVWMLLDDPTDAGTTAPVTAEPAAAASRPVDDLQAPKATRSALEPLEVVQVVEEIEPVEDPVPASYRAALGGLIGRVVLESGEPVPDLPLSLAGGGVMTLPPLDAIFSDAGSEIDPILGSTTTDHEGRFAFHEINPRILGVLLLDPGGPRAMMQLLEETPVTGSVRDLGDIVMPGCVKLSGQIVDNGGDPIPGVRVRATDLPGMIVSSGVADFREGGGVLVSMPEGDEEMTFVGVPERSLTRFERYLPLPTTTTDGEGRFELDGVPVGVVSLIADDGLHQTLVKGTIPTGDAGGHRDLGLLTMGDGYPLSGRVVNTSGKPVEGAEVMAGNQMVMGPVTILRPPVVTDADGRFHVPGLRDGAARAVGRADESASYEVSTEGVAGGEVTITLQAGRQLTLSVVDEEGEPVAGATFMGRNLPDDDAEDMPDFIFPPRNIDKKVEVDEQGRYVVGHLTPGLWDIAVKAPGRTFDRDVYDVRFSDNEAQVTLPTELELSVRVVRQGSGDPVEWALVAVREADRSGPMPITSARTDADGYARLTGLSEGDYGLDVTHPALAVMAAEANVPTEEAVVVEMPVGGTIVGTVLDNGQPPIEPLMIMLEPRGDQPPAGEMPRMTLSQLDGSFSFTNVEPGEVKLEARDRVQFTNLTSWWEPFAMTALAEGSAFVEADKESETTLIVGSTYDDIETGTVSGQLFVNGHPGGNWKVRTWGQIRRSVTTGPDGRFNMGRLAAGKVVLMFSPADASMRMMGGSVDTHEFELVPQGAEFIEMAITTGKVRGRVFSSLDGRPVEGAMVAIKSSGGGGWWGGRGSAMASGNDGRFEFETVAEGEYVLQAEADGYARARSEPFDVRGMGTVDGLELQLSSALVASGRFAIEGVDASPDWMWMTAESDTGLEAATRPDVDQGTFEFDDLAPGTWTFTLHTSLGEEFSTLTEAIHTPRSDLVLVFSPAPEAEDPEVTDKES